MRALSGQSVVRRHGFQFRGDIPPAVEDSDDIDLSTQNSERDGHATLESQNSQPRLNIAARGPAIGENLQTCAGVGHAGDKPFGCPNTGLRGQIVEQRVQVGLGRRPDNDLDARFPLPRSCGPAVAQRLPPPARSGADHQATPGSSRASSRRGGLPRARGLATLHGPPR